MSDAAMHRSESGEQASPSVVPPLQHLFAVPVGDLLELLLKRRNGIIVIVKRLAQMQEPALFGRKQKHKPHHYRKHSIVDHGFRPILQQSPMALSITPIH